MTKCHKECKNFYLFVSLFFLWKCLVLLWKEKLCSYLVFTLQFLHRVTIFNFVAENSEVKLTGNRARAELKLISWAWSIWWNEKKSRFFIVSKCVLLIPVYFYLLDFLPLGGGRSGIFVIFNALEWVPQESRGILEKLKTHLC